MSEYLSLSETAEIVGKSKQTLRRWDNEGILNAVREPGSEYRVYRRKDVQTFLGEFYKDNIEETSNFIEPEHSYSVL